MVLNIKLSWINVAKWWNNACDVKAFLNPYFLRNYYFDWKSQKDVNNKYVLTTKKMLMFFSSD